MTGVGPLQRPLEARDRRGDAIRLIDQPVAASLCEDRELGIQSLGITAEKGHYLKPYARLLLAVDALRHKDSGQAREILRDLARQFPHNRLYAEELARLQ